MEPHHLALPVGFQIEHFRIEAVLGKGGFGITYLAVDLQLGKRVAIKELLPDTIATRVEGLTVVPHSHGMQENWEWARERFLEEARTLATFSHPAIVGVHRLIEANGTVYMVMDYVEGESYEARLQRIGTEPDQESLMAVIGPILSGLEEVHSHGLLHRDIKPENILIDKRGQPVLIDFGSARESVGKTMTMTSIVTHGYSPIEQYQTKGRMGPWTDIYAMAAVMCRAIAGEKPPVASDRVIEEVYGGLVPSGSSGYSRSLCSAIDWALRVRPEERPQSIEEWKEKFVEAWGGEAITPEQDPALNKAFKAQCPHCSQRVEMDASMRGALVDCPSCRESFRAGSYDSLIPESSKRVLLLPAQKGRWPFVVGAITAGLLIVGASLMLLIPESRDKTRAKGFALIHGDGAQKDVTSGIKLLERAAEKGDLEAQLFLGGLFSKNNPEGPAQDVAAAIRWYTMAAEQGSALAQYNLGVIHYSAGPPAESGTLNFRWWIDSALPKSYAGPGQGPEEAAKWWREAAEQGNPEAQMLLGLAYSDGVGVAEDAAQAATWWKKAAEQGLAGAQYLLGLAYSDGRGIDEDKSEALTWYGKAAKQGDGRAELALAYLYQNGGGDSFGPDPAKALELFRRAAQRDDPDAQLELGNAYARGDGVARNLEEAASWYAKAAEQGNAEAQYLLAVLMHHGEGVDKNENAARKLFAQAVEECRKAAERGEGDAQFAMHTMYANGYGVKQDSEQAGGWFVKALRSKSALAILWVDTLEFTFFDGIRNSWIIEHGLDFTNPKLPEDDPDQDGFSNLEEHDAGTDPLSATSKPQAKDAGSDTPPAPLASSRTPGSSGLNIPLRSSSQTPNSQRSKTSAALIPNLPDPIAIVEGEPISRSDLEETYLNALASAGINGEDLSLDQKMAGFREILDELIVDRLISRKAASVNISDAELEAEISQVKSKFPSEENFREEMAKAGETMASFRDTVRKMIQQQKWMDGQIAGQIRVTDSEVRQFYDKNTKEFEHPAMVRASHILITVPEGATDEVVAEKKLVAEKALRRVSRGREDFASVAKEMSEEPGASDSGGDLNYFPKDRMVPEFANAAFAMRNGEISIRPIRTKFGWHVITVTDRKQAGTMAFTEVKEQVREYLEGGKRRDAVKSVINEVRADAAVVSKFPKGP